MKTFKEWADEWNGREEEGYHLVNSAGRKEKRNSLRVMLRSRLELVIPYVFGENRLARYRARHSFELTQEEVQKLEEENIQKEKELIEEAKRLIERKKEGMEEEIFKKEKNALSREMEEIKIYPYGKEDIFCCLSEVEIELFELLLTAIKGRKFDMAKKDNWNEIEETERIVELLEELSETEKWSYILKDIEEIKFRLLYPTVYKCCHVVRKACRGSEPSIKNQRNGTLEIVYRNMAWAIENAYAECEKIEKKEMGKRGIDVIEETAKRVAEQMYKDKDINSN